MVHEVLGRGAQGATRGGARCASQVLDGGAQAKARGTAQVLGRGSHAAARSAARCASQGCVHLPWCPGRCAATLPQQEKNNSADVLWNGVKTTPLQR
jgi:hypothetical protein